MHALRPHVTEPRKAALGPSVAHQTKGSASTILPESKGDSAPAIARMSRSSARRWLRGRTVTQLIEASKSVAGVVLNHEPEGDARTVSYASAARRFRNARSGVVHGR